MRWEYKTLKVDVKGLFGGQIDESAFGQQLNSLGAEGWELQTAFDPKDWNGSARQIICVFKRPCD